jgi:hypothetical protein
MVIVAAFVKKLDCLGQRQEAVRKSSRNINLVLVFRTEENASPLAEVRRASTNIQYYVKRFAFHNAAQLCLRMAQLIVQPSQRPFPRTRMVVLDESLCDSKLAQFCEMECLQEKTSRVAKDSRT